MVVGRARAQRPRGMCATKDTANIPADGLGPVAAAVEMYPEPPLAESSGIVGAPPGREYPQTNGWTFWRFRDADGNLAFVDALRQRHFAG